jgi:alanine racemase
MTHFATADEPTTLPRGADRALLGLGRTAARAPPGLLVHAENSAALLACADAPVSTWHAAASRSTASIRLVEDPPARGLEPALELRSWVAALKPCAPG